MSIPLDYKEPSRKTRLLLDALDKSFEEFRQRLVFIYDYRRGRKEFYDALDKLYLAKEEIAKLIRKEENDL
jgi:hypothetical protein